MLVTLPFVLRAARRVAAGAAGAPGPRPRRPARRARPLAGPDRREVAALRARRGVGASSPSSSSGRVGAVVPVEAIPPAQPRRQRRCSPTGATSARPSGRDGLAVFYPYRPTPDCGRGRRRGALGLAARDGRCALRQCAGAPTSTVGWLWYLGMLVPVIGLVQVGRPGATPTATPTCRDRLVIALVWGVGDLAARSRPAGSRRRPRRCSRWPPSPWPPRARWRGGRTPARSSPTRWRSRATTRSRTRAWGRRC